jgi:ornithine cyclodeaminase/alanine dehydrogenase-like protein (mu-crystallin family)
VKVIGANAFNRRLGLPRSTSTIVLLEKMTMRPVAVLDGTAISARRTGTYASTVFERCFGEGGEVSVFIFGAGPIARDVILCLDHVGSDRIREICVRSRTYEGAASMVAHTQPQTTIPLIPVADNSRLCDCAFVVTASNARQPVFEDGELAADAVTLHLGGDEVPQAYLQRALRTGTLVCDSLAMVSHRRSQSLALHFWRNGLSLETVGPLLGVHELSATQDWYSQPDGPVCITCVGLPMLDLYVAQATYEKYQKARGTISAAD